jgi:diketogulonate reductase-like aldo/keto reductase
MSETDNSVTRRQALVLGAGAAVAGTFGFDLAALAQASRGVMKRPIPHSGEMIPIVGIGTARIYDFPVTDVVRLAERAQVLKLLVEGGGALVDTAPSYGEAEVVLGKLFALTKLRDKIFLTTKVSVDERKEQMESMRESLSDMGVKQVQLMQLHNPKKPEQDIDSLRAFQKEGLCKYIGISSSFDRDYKAVEAVLRREKPDFFQIDYSLVDRNSEDRLIPAARDVGAAVLTNLPFRRGKVFAKIKNNPLPDWAKKELGVTTWAQFALKWLLGNPGVTAVIPGTDKPKFMVDNLKAGRGVIPDADMRKKMAAHFDSL